MQPSQSPTARAAAAPLAPALPVPRGSLSEAVIDALRRPPGGVPLPRAGAADPLGADAQLALLAAYELHYRGFRDVDDAWEWDPALLRLRSEIEHAFLSALRDRCGAADDPMALLDEAATEPADADGISQRLRDGGTWDRMREYFIHRSVLQLKESDAYAWGIPRLQGQAKASLTAVAFDEFGAGHGDHVHAGLYAALLEAAGLDAGYLAYVDDVPAAALAVANLPTLLGLHRSLRGALTGHFAATERSTGPAARRLVEALRRMEAPEPCVYFYTEHVEADAVHEQVVRHDIVAPLLAGAPELAGSVAFGIAAAGAVEDDLTAHVLGRWDADQPSLPDGLLAPPRARSRRRCEVSHSG